MTERSKVSPIDKSIWVVNIPKRKLSPIEEKVLQRGSGFAIADKDIRYNDEYVNAVQQASKSLCQSQALALKAEVTEILKQAGPNRSNLLNTNRRLSTT